MRRRILLLVVGMTVLVVLAFAVPLAILVRTTTYDNAVTDLGHDVTDIAVYLQQSRTAPTSAELTSELKTFDDVDASVQLPDTTGGTVTVLGTAPPGTPPVVGSYGGSPFGRGGGRGPGDGHFEADPMTYHGGRLAQRPVPRFSQAGGTYIVRVYASDSQLRSGEDGPLLLLAGSSVLLIALGVALGEWLTRRIVRPLSNTADTAARLAAGDITARATTSGPAEVAEVGRALNRLADRIDQLIAEERETVADLSHRLRTPLTALRLDAEALRDDSDAERIGGHVTALERMLTAVIRAARRPQREGRMPSSDATAVVGERVAFWSALTEDQGRSGELDLPDRPLPVRTSADDLAAAVDALLENVVAHTPEGTAFAVRLAATPSGARLEIADDGPGLPADEPVRGRSDRGSTGLGLDIARRCAEASGGAMTLASTPAGGARIVLDLGGP